MKRANKCASKKAYTHLSHALNVAKKWYLESGTLYAIYTCPSCLDFHLTSKYCNTSKYHRRWLVDLARQLREEEIKFDNKFFPSVKLTKRQRKRRNAKANKKKRLSGIKPQSKSQINKRYKLTKKERTLPLAEQRAILAGIDNKKLSTPKSFWSSIIGIINPR